jgi:uncharacterized tellurite resistance protein B-like protein
MTNKTEQSAATAAKTMITQIVEKIATPNGFVKLSPPQRKFLLAAILGSIVPADGKVRNVELEQLESHLKQKYKMTSESLKQALSFASTGLHDDHLQQATRHLPDLLSIVDRTNLVGMLWDIALSDHELHGNEESMIYKIADTAGVLRKRVIEQQALAAGHHRT